MARSRTNSLSTLKNFRMTESVDSRSSASNTRLVPLLTEAPLARFRRKRPMVVPVKLSALMMAEPCRLLCAPPSPVPSSSVSSATFVSSLTEVGPVLRVLSFEPGVAIILSRFSSSHQEVPGHGGGASSSMASCCGSAVGSSFSSPALNAGAGWRRGSLIVHGYQVRSLVCGG